jgi:membrane associated rhomboid family serine protease
LALQLVELIVIDSAREAEDLRLVLESIGVFCRVDLVANGRASWRLLVAASDLERARGIVESERKPDTDRGELPAEHPWALPDPPPFYWVAALIVINFCVFLVLEGRGGSTLPRTLVRFGANHYPSVAAGEWWRLGTAMFLHIGLGHLLGNMITLGLLGAVALRMWGTSRFYFMYLVSGAAGNLLSHALHPSLGAKAGASGAILGLLGALAGARLRHLRSATASRFRAWHVVAGIIALYGLLLGSGSSDHFAHLGGIAAGAIVSFVLPVPGSLSDRGENAFGLGLWVANLALSLAPAAILIHRLVR